MRDPDDDTDFRDSLEQFEHFTNEEIAQLPDDDA